MSKKAVIEKFPTVAPTSDAPAPPAYFLSVSVKNFRCFGEKQTLDLSDGNGNPKFWTIILGDNGVGKTTLLQCIAMLQFLALRQNDDEIEETGYVPTHLKHDPTFYDGALSHSVGMRAFSIDGRAQIESNLIGGTEGYSSEIYLSLGWSKHFHPLIEATVGEGKVINGLICYGYGASRRPGPPAIREEQSQDTCASLFKADAELINPVEGLLQADYAASKGHERPKRRLQTIKDVFVGLLPDVEDFKFEPLNDETDLPTAQAKTPYGWVPVRSLSLGYQSMMTWTLDLASRLSTRYPDSPNPLAEPAIVLVDEIDLHLHPKWQRTLVQFLTDTFPKTQFIVTAHSPLVVQSAPDANIVVLRREGDHVVIDNDVKVVEGWRADQILTSDLFGLSSARPPEWDAYLDERDQLLSKQKLSDKDHARLKELEVLISRLPTGETSSDLEAMNIIRRAAMMIKRREESAK